MNNPVILVKLGGSAITNKNIPYQARKRVIRRLANEFKKRDKSFDYIIAHGSGSFGHSSAKRFGGVKGYKSRIGVSRVSRDATAINQIFTDIFVEEGLPVISLRPMSMMTAKNGKLYKFYFENFDELLNQDLVPVVFGDIIWDKEWKSTIFSGEKTIFEITRHLIEKKYKIKKVIQVGETNGVYDGDENTIEAINKKNYKKFKLKKTYSKRTDVTGGIKHKLNYSLDLAEMGIETIVINGLIKGEFEKALNNRKINGTKINL